MCISCFISSWVVAMWQIHMIKQKHGSASASSWGEVRSKKWNHFISISPRVPHHMLTVKADSLMLDVYFNFVVSRKRFCHRSDRVKVRSYSRRCASADVGGQKLTLFQLAHRCPQSADVGPMSNDASMNMMKWRYRQAILVKSRWTKISRQRSGRFLGAPDRGEYYIAVGFDLLSVCL